MSPTVAESSAAPLSTSTPLAQDKTTSLHSDRKDSEKSNGHDAVDTIDNSEKKRDSNCNTINENVNVTVIESTSMDVLSGGESDAGDTLSRRNNNSISSNMKTGTFDTSKRRADITYFIAKELLMTERTYKRDLELITVNWSGRVSNLATTESDGAAAVILARGCLALEPIALSQGALLARLERTLISDNEEPEYKKIGELLQDHLTNTHEAYSSYIENVSTLVALIESVRRSNKAAAQECTAFDNGSPLPLACLLLRPLHRLLYYRMLVNELSSSRSIIYDGDSQTERQLHHIENHASLCQLQRDIIGYEKLLIADREFIRLGCVYKHSQKGLQQRMLFLFNDILIVTSRTTSSHARAHVIVPLQSLQINTAHLPHSFTLTSDDVNLLISTSNDNEYRGWYDALEHSIEQAKLDPKEIDTELTDPTFDAETSDTAIASHGGVAHVCWHRATSIDRDRLHLAYRTQLSGYLLRKFKNSHGWQKLWVVFAAFTLYFYKSWQDDAPLASLPLLGYVVSSPAESDGIHKDFVFKLQFKNHVYFFRADSSYTYNRWTEVLQTPMVHRRNNR